MPDYPDMSTDGFGLRPDILRGQPDSPKRVYCVEKLLGGLGSRVILKS